MPQEIASASESESRGVMRRVFLAGRREAIAAFALGAVSVAGFAPLYLFPLPLITLALLMSLWRRAESPKRAAILGWWFGLGYFLTGVSWVYVSLHTFGAMPAPLAAFFTLVFCAFLALFPAITGYCFAAVRVPLWIKLTVIAPAAWTLTEWTRGWIFTGFPWLALGYSQVPSSPLAGFAPVLGVYGVTLVTVLVAGLLVLLADELSRQRQTNGHRKARLVLALLAVGLAGYAFKQIPWTTP
ncbi:MAG: apolipoprotein N-acyltransferase, partial [Betaproteobacteria bacterium]|nr:apolipoprotein N-acyltransferase [Betaproteobacteria bacterium]